MVYMAEQTEPVERRVALKIIKPGMDTRQVIARFEAERQALAMMDHPNIAKVLDAGTTDTGRPYFVMELVKGVPITQYCDEHQTDATRAAGTVHRRLPGRAARPSKGDHSPRHQAVATCWSPSTTIGRSPRSSTLAWPRRLQQRLTEKTMFTAVRPDRRHARVHEPRAGQAEPTGHRYTQRHLFAGRAALRTADRRDAVRSQATPQSAAFDEMLRIIREEEPPTAELQAQHAASRCRRSPPIGTSNPRSSARWSAASWTGS